MKAIKCIVLPLFLCGVLLLGGYFAPELYARFSSDRIGEVQAVTLAGAESPMYIADGAAFDLAPWDAIDEEDSVLFSELLDVRLYVGQEGDSYLRDAWTNYFYNIIFAVDESAATLEPDMYTALRAVAYTGNYNTTQYYVYLRDFTYSHYGTAYTFDFVMSTEYESPLYVYIAREHAETTPLANAEQYVDFLPEIFTYVNDAMYNDYLGSAYATEGYLGNSNILYVTTYEMLYNLARDDAGAFVLTGRYFANLMYDQPYSAYTIEHDSLTYLVCPDSQNNPLVLFCDGTTESVRGFSLTPASLDVYFYEVGNSSAFPYPTEASRGNELAGDWG